MKNYRFDKRLVKRNLKKGIITQKDYDEHLKKLPDNNNNKATIDIGKELKEIIKNRNSGGK